MQLIIVSHIAKLRRSFQINNKRDYSEVQLTTPRGKFEYENNKGTGKSNKPYFYRTDEVAVPSLFNFLALTQVMVK